MFPDRIFSPTFALLLSLFLIQSIAFFQNRITLQVVSLNRSFYALLFRSFDRFFIKIPTN